MRASGVGAGLQQGGERSAIHCASGHPAHQAWHPAVSQLIASALVAPPRQPIAKSGRQQSGKTVIIDPAAPDPEPLLPLLRPPQPLR